MQPRAVADAIRSRASAAGIDRASGHSLRVGAAVSMAQRGARRAGARPRAQAPPALRPFEIDRETALLIGRQIRGGQPADAGRTRHHHPPASELQARPVPRRDRRPVPPLGRHQVSLPRSAGREPAPARPSRPDRLDRSPGEQNRPLVTRQPPPGGACVSPGAATRDWRNPSCSARERRFRTTLQRQS